MGKSLNRIAANALYMRQGQLLGYTSGATAAFPVMLVTEAYNEHGEVSEVIIRTL